MHTPSPDASEPPSEALILATARLLATVAHPGRLQVLLLLQARGALSAGELQAAVGVAQSTLSHQLRLLRDARLVTTERRGRQIIYSLADHHVAHIVRDALEHAREETVEPG